MNKYLRTQAKATIQRILSLAGLRLSYIKNEFPFISVYPTDIIIDIGANVGQYATDIIAAGYEGKIVSIEPIPSIHQILKKNAEKYPNWEVYECTALGDQEGEISFNISKNYASSSALILKEEYQEVSPETKLIDKIYVNKTTLNNIYQNLHLSQQSVGLKIDTQGYEMEILKGAEKMLDKCKWIQVELSLEELYEGQPLYMDVINYLGRFGFILKHINEGYTNPKNGMRLQFDGVFIKP